MRSNLTKQASTITKSKSKKVMEYVHLLSTHEQDKTKKIHHKTNPKTNINHQFSAHNLLSSNRIHLDKEKFSINLNHQLKKHNRSKTQYFKPVTQTTYPDDISEEDIIISKQDMKKKTMKKDESQRRLKTQSSKRLHNASQQKINLNHSRTQLKQQTTKNVIISTKNISAKSSKLPSKPNPKYYANNQQTQKKYISSINENIHILKDKLKKDKSTYSAKDKLHKNTDKQKQQDSKNMTFLNLSQILQRNDCDEDIFGGRDQRKINSNRQRKNAKSNSNAQKLKAIFSSLQQRIDYMTGSITQMASKRQVLMKNSLGAKQKLDGRSFSFMQNPMISANIGKSNFSTGQGSIGPDYELQELLRIKNATQSQVNRQISKDLNAIREIYQTHQGDSRPKTARVYEGDLNKKEKSSARTYEREQQNEKDLRQCGLDDKQVLVNLLSKYHEMTIEILPLLSEINLKESRNEQNPEMGDGKKKRKSQDLREENKKFISKYNQVMEKNFRYQQLINSLIQGGVDVQKYLQATTNRKG